MIHHHTRRLFAAAVGALLLPGLLTACSSGSDAPTGRESGDTVTSSRLGSCMRDKGYDYEDPKAGASSEQLKVPDGVDATKYQEDLLTCSGAGSGAGAGEAEGAAPAPVSAETRKQAVSCVRDHGFADYPDGEEDQRTYEPSDPRAFGDVEKTCWDEAFAAAGLETN
ncbi:hypothetical protein AABM26_04695 [Curtobacterium aetherium]|uniref:hypothetical protein n=1 Tax=Curtobacterium aetherium TaxID=2841594 RepID=UPI003B522066